MCEGEKVIIISSFSPPAVKGYPVIDGVVFANNLAFARFFDSGCSYNIYTVGNNPLSPDGVHPMHMTETTLFNVEKNSLAFFYEPDVAWIVQEVNVEHTV